MSEPAAQGSKSPARSPFAGCTIIVVIFLVGIFALSVAIWSVFRQYEEIVKFTDTEPKPTQLVTLEGKETQLNDLNARLLSFQNDLNANPPREATLTLTTEELNNGIAAYENFKDLRQTLFVREITDKGLEADISFKMNGKPLSGEFRYLNGSITARPELTSKELVLRVDSLEIPNATVPKPFLEHFSTYRIFERYKEDPNFGPVMKKLTSVTWENGKVILRSKPGETPPNTVSDSQFQSGKERLIRTLGIIASCFLAIVGLFVLIGLRGKARKDSSNS